MPLATLQSATTSTFEELALLLAEPAEDGGATVPLAGGVRVSFSGPLSGHLTVHVTGDLLGAVAANMLGRDVDPADPICRDALGELANVLCGTLLPSLAGRRAEFRLAPPAWLSPSSPAAAASPAGATAAIRLALEPGRAEVALHLTGDVPPADARSLS